MNAQLAIVSELPEGFYDFEPGQILALFPTPTLVHLKGEKSPPLFVSILLHGNEYSGLKSVQALLKKYVNGLPRSVFLFIGNVAATAVGLRVIPSQTDYNRCWPGTEMATNNETIMMQAVVDCVTQQPLFAAIDLHNNSGFNPHYAGITSVTDENKHLAAMFNHIGLFFTRPKGVSTMVFDQVCPAATLECGRPGEIVGIEHATELLDALLHMDHFPERALPSHDLQLLQTHATVTIPKQISIDFDLSSEADLCFQHNFDHLNFTEIKPGDVFAHTQIEEPLTITNQLGEDVTNELMRVENSKVYLNKTLMPAMITMDEAIIRQDCLCHLLVDYRNDGFF